MLKETFAERLKTAMDLQGKKQVDLIRIASLQGVKLGKSHISQYVNGKTLPREDILHFLAETLQVKEEWLMGKENQTTGETEMREFKKSSKLDNVLYDVRGPVVDEAERMEDAGMHILKLNIGNACAIFLVQIIPGKQSQTGNFGGTSIYNILSH